MKKSKEGEEREFRSKTGKALSGFIKFIPFTSAFLVMILGLYRLKASPSILQVLLNEILLGLQYILCKRIKKDEEWGNMWCRLRKRGYTRRQESLFRVLRRLGLSPSTPKKEHYKPKSYEQMTYPDQRVQVDVKVVPGACITDPTLHMFQYTVIDKFSRLRFLAYEEQFTYPSADFLKRLVKWYRRRGITVECVRTDNGFDFTNRFSHSKWDLPTLFEKTAAELDIRHKLIRPYTPRHNGKVERSHREDRRRFYDSHRFFSLNDFAVHNARSNKSPMRPLHWLSPLEFPLTLDVQIV